MPGRLHQGDVMG